MRPSLFALTTALAIIAALIACGESGSSAPRGTSARPAGPPPARGPAESHVATPAGPLTAAAALELRPYTDVPAVGAAAEKFRAGDNAGCVAALTPWLHAHGDSPMAGSVHYLRGVCRFFAGKHGAAADELTAVAAAHPLLADYARYFAGRARAKTGDTDGALALLDAIPKDSSQRRRASEMACEIAAGAGRDDAPARIRRHIARYPNATGALRGRLAEVLEAKGDVPAAIEARWEQWAAEPRSAEAKAVPAAVAALKKKLPKAKRAGVEEPGVKRRLARATALFRAHRSERAIEELEPVIERSKQGSDIWCEAHHLSARSWDKLRKRVNSHPHYDAALAHCPHHGSRVKILFFGGKSAHQDGKPERALKFFEKLHREFPEHSYNDDALLREADIHDDAKSPKRARAALERALAQYPEGDMREDAAWLLLWEEISAKRWGAAVKRAEKNLALIPRETSYRSRGRTLYWKARALQKAGRRGPAKETYRACLTAYPLSWYGGLAYARLHALSPKAARETLREVVAADAAPAGPLEDGRPLGVTARAEFRVGLELLRLGLPAPARRELERLFSGTGDDPAADWLLAALYAQVGDYPRSHNIARRKRPEFAEHWPKGDHVRYWKLAYPLPFQTLARKAAAAEKVPEWLVHAIMREESGFDAGIESWANAVGLMQLLVPTARDLRDKGDPPASRQTLKRAPLNVKWGTRFLAKLYHRYGDSPALAASGYNAGPGRMKKWLKKRGSLPLDEWVESIPFRQTRGYTKRVTESYLRYQFLYGAEPGTLPVLPLKISPR